ncbi:MAG: hypothetical protein IKL10_03090 [Clostridia bacterium]|nr:hypothetical protein [Clostridia bacterium]
MKNKRYGIFSFVSLVIITIYALLNLYCISFWLIEWNIGHTIENVFSRVAMNVLTLDLFTWHVFGAFCFITLIIKAISLKNNKILREKRFIVDIILHALLSLCIVGCICFLFSKAF